MVGERTMNNTHFARKALAGAVLSFALLGMSNSASAAGVVLSENDLSAATRAGLKIEIEKARIATPELFKTVADVVARARAIDDGARAKGVPFTMHFKPLGNR